MAFVLTDWSITAATKAIRYIGDDHSGSSPSYCTVLEFHRALQAMADDESYTGDDQIDITKLLPSDKKFDTIVELINGYNIDDNASEHIYGGSIIQGGGDTIYDGIINYGNADVQIQIIQNGAILSDDWWNYNDAGLNADSAKGASHQFMIKVRTSGADIDGRRLIGICRRFGYTYSEFPIGAGTGRGVNTLALSDANDLNNNTAIGTVAGWTGITNSTSGYNGIDVDANGSDEYYYSEWNKASYTINQFFERIKWLSRDGSSSTLYGLSGELFRGITHEIPVDGQGGTDFSAYEEISWGSGATAGTGQMLAVNDVNAASKMWMQLLTGVVPTNNMAITGGTSGATCNVNGSVTERPISKPFCGQSTGSAIIGAYGFGIESADLGTNDSVIDLDNNTVNPPNNVQYTVSGLVVGEDRVLVTSWDGSATDPEGNPAIEIDQLSISTAITGSTTSITVSETIPTDTPSTGTIRVVANSGKEYRCVYSSYSTHTFTIASTNFSSDHVDVGNDCYIAYLDKLSGATSESFTCVYSADRQFVVIVRDGGGTPIKQFISSGSLGSNGGSISVIRASDA